MSDELFEVAFSGEILEGKNPEEVKVRVGKVFNADAAKIAQLFSGKRVVIKKNLDQQTADKYRNALNRAGAQCEIRSIAPIEPASSTAPTAPTIPPPAQAVDYGDVAPPPQTVPLGITGDQIEDLSVSVAPVGSTMQDSIKQVEAPVIDISGIDVAPVGSNIGSGKKEPDPPPPDTTGLSMAD